MGRLRTGVLVALLMTCSAAGGTRIASWVQAPAGIVVRLGGNVPQALDGRLLLLISKDGTREPRFQVSSTSLETAQLFGLDVEGFKAGSERTFDAGILGCPLESLGELPPGQYTVQALLHKYETFHLATGHTVKLPMDRGEGQQWSPRP
jgi:hypothetical protein